MTIRSHVFISRVKLSLAEREGGGGGGAGAGKQRQVFNIIDNWPLSSGSTAEERGGMHALCLKHVLKSLRVLSIVELAQLRVRGGHGSRPLDQQQAAVCTLPNHDLHTVLPVRSTHKPGARKGRATSIFVAWSTGSTSAT